MAGHVNTEPSGIGESLLFYDTESMFRGWDRIAVNVTPATAFRTFGHMETARFNRPGDAPVVWSLANDPRVRPGSPTALGIYDRAALESEREGWGWDSDVAQAPRMAEQTGGAEELPEGWRWENVGGQRIAVGGASYDNAEAARAAGQTFVPPEDDPTIWGAIKGGSRWLWLAFETIPEGIDALGRAVGYIKDGTMTPREALAGLTQGVPIAGLGSLAALGMSDEQLDEAGELVGIPFFQYLRAGVMEGERLNMGQGIFAGGDVPEDIAIQLQTYDDETHGPVLDVQEGHGLFGLFGRGVTRAGGLTQADFDQRRAAMGGTLLVEGAGGKTYEARSLEEWKFLRDNVGRAALLDSLNQGFSAEQEALGTPYSTYNEWIFDENAVTRDRSSGRYFAHSYGRTPASLVADPGTKAFDNISGALDFQKQLIDLPIAQGAKVAISGANRFIGLSDEAAELAQGTSTLVRMVEGADMGARGAAIDDAVRGTLNLDRATNALARWGDDSLIAARANLEDMRAASARVAPSATAENIDLLVQRAGSGNAAARRILERLMGELGAEDTVASMDNLLGVVARPDTDLFRGVMGTAQVAPEALEAARAQATHLQRLLSDGRASVVYDPVTGKQMLTFDAEIGRAQATASTLRSAVDTQLAGRNAAATRYSDAVRAYQDEMSQLSSYWGDPVRLYHGTRTRQAVASIEAQGKLVPGPSQHSGRAVYLTPSEEYAAQFAKSQIKGGQVRRTGQVFGVDVRLGRVLDRTTPQGAATFDAAVAQAKNTGRDVSEVLTDQGYDAVRHRLQGRNAPEQVTIMRDVPLETAPLGSQRLAELADEVRAAAADPTLRGVVDETGLVTDGRKLESWRAMDVAEEAERTVRQLATGLFKDNWTMKRRAARFLGDTDLATEDLDNLARVLRRSDGEGTMIGAASEIRPRLDPDRLSKYLTGQGRATQLVDMFVNARTHDEIQAILRPTVEHTGLIPRGLVEALAKAEDPAQVVDALLRHGAGQTLVPPRMALLEGGARFGALATLGGMGVGAAAAVEQELAEGGTAGDVIGAGLGGAVVGALAGSAIGGVGGFIAGKGSRSIENVADAMDLLLAGSRATVTQTLIANGFDMGRAQAGLSVPTQLSYAYGHSAVGRRFARSASVNMNLNDPDDFYWKLSDYAKSLGMRLNDEVQIYTRPVGEGGAQRRVLVSRLEPEEAQRQIAELEADGYHLARTASMDDVLTRAASMVANNPARGHEVLTRFGAVADAVLSSKGMDDARIDLLTSAFKEGAQHFLGITDAAGTPRSYELRAVLGDELIDPDDGFKLDSELWSGHIDLPDPVRVQRAVNQLDKVGRTVQLFTGAGVAKQIRANLRRIGTDEGWQRITPELERNIATRIARVATSAVWGPIVLLGRTGSFVTKVLGEDQVRMSASSLPSILVHPANYVSAIAANWKTWKNFTVTPFKARYGITSRAPLADILPDELVDENGDLLAGVVDDIADMGHWGVAESARHSLSFYDRDAVKGRKGVVYGSRGWVPINRGDRGPSYVNGLTHEYRQLAHSPIIRHMVRSKADDPITDTVRWLKDTPEGQAVARDWARQFHTDAEAARFMGDDVLEAFLKDEWARVHLKTGGDWIYVLEKGVVLDSAGNALNAKTLKARGWDQLEAGYHITRRGDDELLDILRRGELTRRTELKDATGRMVLDDAGEVIYVERELRVADKMNQERWDAIRELIARKHGEFEARAEQMNYNALSEHRFPRVVKGPRMVEEEIGRSGISSSWDELIDILFDFVLAKPSRILSRQPTFGGFYWERMGMLYPSMSKGHQATIRALAEQEGAWGTVSKIAREFRQNGPVAPNTLDDWATIDLNAKAYATERTKDTLFDLHRQRNFIDGARLIFPFAGPFVEAMEAWGRVIKRDPLRVWRRGTQVVSHTWNTSGIGDQPDPFGQGWFYVDPTTGEERFDYPFIGSMFGSLGRALTGGEVSMTDAAARARGLNVVFGPDDLTAGEGPELAGFPLQAFNPGIGPVLNLAAPLFWRDRTGASRELFEYFFPYGEPDSFAAAALPYNLRKLWDGINGIVFNSKDETLISNSMDQLARMVAGGEAGMGTQFRFDLNTPGGVTRAQEESRDRASWAAIFEGVARTLLPSLITPEVTAEIEADPRLSEFPTEALSTVDALGNYARELLTPEGAVWWNTPDGYRVSTEGDWEAVTEYMNDMFGTQMFSAEFLSLPLTDRAAPRAYTAAGLDHARSHADLYAEWRSTASLLLPDYAGNKSLEDEPGEYSFEAFDLARSRGDAKTYTFDEQTFQLESRLLKLRKRQIELEAIELFGHDDVISDEQAERKDNWINQRSQEASSQFASGDINAAQADEVRAELRGWSRPDWDWNAQGLSREELQTVDAVLWYNDLVRQAEELLSTRDIDSISHKGSSDEAKAFARAVRADVRNAVRAQMDHSIRSGAPMGNFPFIYSEYLEPELLEDEEEFDAMGALVELRRGDYGFEELNTPFSPVSPSSFGVGYDYAPAVGNSVTVTESQEAYR